MLVGLALGTLFVCKKEGSPFGKRGGGLGATGARGGREVAESLLASVTELRLDLGFSAK